MFHFQRYLPNTIITPDACRLQKYLCVLDEHLAEYEHVTLIVYGSAAVSLYLADSPRGIVGMTDDIDVQGGVDVKTLNRIAPPAKPSLEFRVSSITNWLIHPDWEDHLIDVSTLLGLNSLTIKLLSPIDLILTKLERYSERDIEDCVKLVQRYVNDKKKFEAYLMEAIQYVVGLHPITLQRIKEEVVDDLFDESQ